MADLTITAANVAVGTGGGAQGKQTKAGVNLTAGQLCYEDSSTTPPTQKLCDTDSATAAVRVPSGIALHGSLTGQPLQLHTKGPIVIGATVVPGEIYVASGTAGGIAPRGDLAAGDYTAIVGIGISETEIDVNIQAPNVALV